MADVASTSSSSSLPPVEPTGRVSVPAFSHGKKVQFSPLHGHFSPLPGGRSSSPWAPPSYDDSDQNILLASGGLPTIGTDQSIPWRAPPGETDAPSYDWADAPETDVEDNDKELEPVYRMNHALPSIPGYEKTKDSKPAERPNLQIPQSGKREFKSGDKEVSQDEAKGFLLHMTSDHCCYGNRAAKDMDIESIEYSSATRYTLETFVESRNSKRSHIPYKGQVIDGPQGGAPPAIWDAVNEASEKYKPGVQTEKVPHCSTIETCYACSGRGFNKCYRCKGRGRTKCKYCKAKGQRGNKDCEYCRGKGRQRCFRCNGHAVITCSVCEAYKQLEFYVEVISKFSVKKDEYLYHAEKRLPRKLLRGIEGITLFEEEAHLVAPLSNFPSTDVNSQSERLVLKHANVNTERLLSQRHTLVGIPIAQVEYSWKGKAGRFWLYGQKRRVYAPDYPQQCCCSCRCTIC